MDKILTRPLLAIAFLIFTGMTVQLSAQTVSGSIASAARGGQARGSVVLTIPGALHVNSNRPASEYAIPTTVRLTGSGVKVSGARYPRGTNRKFQFSENLINVYEGRAAFPFTVSIPANFRGNTVRVRAVIRYQSLHGGGFCYPPKTVEVTLTGKIS